MVRLPLTYAVFYHAIICPNTTNTQIIVNNILFTGEAAPSVHHPAYFSSNIGCGYTSGAKKISQNIIDIISNQNLNELSRRISLINLQDLPATYNKLVALIPLLDLSEELKNSLQADSRTMDMTTFIAKVFQLSIKGDNERLRLKGPHKKGLHSPNINQIVEAFNLQNSPVEPNEETPYQDDTLVSDSEVDDIFNIIEPTSEDLDEFAQLKEEWGYDENKPNPFEMLKSPHVFFQELELPRDYDLLLQVVAPIVLTPAFINLDYADLSYAIGFDPYNKTCRPGKLMLINAICTPPDYKHLETILVNIENAQNCIISFSLGTDNGLLETEEVTSLVSSYLHPDANILYGMNFNIEETDLFAVQILCLEEVDTQNISEQQITTQNTQPDTAPKETKKELHIPNFLFK